MTRIDELTWQLGMCWSLMEVQLSGLTDAECHWRPSPDSWRVVRDGERWVASWELPEPDPAPQPTIGWITWHAGWWWSEICDRLEGREPLPRADVGWPGTAQGAGEWLRGCQGRWSHILQDRPAADELLAGDGLWWLHGRSFAVAMAWVNAELMKNAAEIGVLRRMHRASLAGAAR